MSYKELFSAIECNRIVIIEDDFKQGEYKKSERCMILPEWRSMTVVGILQRLNLFHSHYMRFCQNFFLYLTNALIKLECGMIAFPTGTLVVRLGWLKE